MIIKNITVADRTAFNCLATHPLQSFEWGEFREKTGIKVLRRGFFDGKKMVASFQLTIHKIPHTSFTIGYLPKGTIPTKEMVEELVKIGKEEKCIFIQLEPNVEKTQNSKLKTQNFNSKFKIVNSYHPLFTKYTFVLDLTKSETDLLAGMHPKTRYNIKVAEKHGVTVKEEDSEEAFNAYLKLTEETTNRQGFFAHSRLYHQTMWKVLGNYSSSERSESRSQKNSSRQARTIHNKLAAHLLVARYNDIPLTTWILFTFHDTLYYPYGASSSEYRNVMSSSLVMWEAIKFGKKMGLKKFDMWGSLGENPDTKDPWYGFHRFKQGFGPELVEFVGSYDLVINPLLYQLYKVADKARWMLLKIKSR